MPRSRILVIDDEPSVTDALRMVLGELGHHVDSARTGAEAKELLKGATIGNGGKAGVTVVAEALKQRIKTDLNLS